MYLAIIILPLLGSIASGFFGRKIGVTGAQIITCAAVVLTTILAVVAFFEVGLNNIPVSIEVFRWIDSESLNVSWGFHFDSLTVSMLIPVLIVSSLVHVYSIGYMSEDPRGCVEGKRSYGDKLSNSGDLLKLKIPSCSRKAISGWTNYSGKVTSFKICENKMDYRGSKSTILNVVKEQRVDDSWLVKSNLTDLRCTLKGFEKNRGINHGFNLLKGWSSRVKIPSKQFSLDPVAPLRGYVSLSYLGGKWREGKVNYSTSTSVNPGIWSGLIDGEGSFSIILVKNPTRKLGWRVEPKFQLDHVASIRDYVSLSYLGGEGSFHIWRNDLVPVFGIVRFATKPWGALSSTPWAVLGHSSLLWANRKNGGAKWARFSIPRTISTYTVSGRPSLYINPAVVTGFVDGEGSFNLDIRKNSKSRLGWSVGLTFQIGLHKKDLEVLEQIKSYFGVGNITSHGSEAVQYRVTSTKGFEKIIMHFDKYPLITQKLADYLLWKRAIEIIISKEHLTLEGIKKIVSIRASINKGLPEELKTAFPEIIPIERPKVELPTNINSNWLAGFTSGEGYFGVVVYNSPKSKLGKSIMLKFQLTQHERDQELLTFIAKYLNCGALQTSRKAKDLQVTNFKDIYDTIIPFFVKNPVLGQKANDFADFVRVAELIKEKAHLTKDGLELITEINSGMNTKRKLN